MTRDRDQGWAREHRHGAHGPLHSRKRSGVMTRCRDSGGISPTGSWVEFPARLHRDHLPERFNHRLRDLPHDDRRHAGWRRMEDLRRFTELWRLPRGRAHDLDRLIRRRGFRRIPTRTRSSLQLAWVDGDCVKLSSRRPRPPILRTPPDAEVAHRNVIAEAMENFAFQINSEANGVCDAGSQDRQHI